MDLRESRRTISFGTKEINKHFLTSTCREGVMIFDGEFECMAFLPDYVINALHDIARSEVHLISLTQLLPELPRRDE
jgi:hypothetical protein